MGSTRTTSVVMSSNLDHRNSGNSLDFALCRLLRVWIWRDLTEGFISLCAVSTMAGLATCRQHVMSVFRTRLRCCRRNSHYVSLIGCVGLVMTHRDRTTETDGWY